MGLSLQFRKSFMILRRATHQSLVVLDSLYSKYAINRTTIIRLRWVQLVRRAKCHMKEGAPKKSQCRDWLHRLEWQNCLRRSNWRANKSNQLRLMTTILPFKLMPTNTKRRQNQKLSIIIHPIRRVNKELKLVVSIKKLALPWKRIRNTKITSLLKIKMLESAIHLTIVPSWCLNWI